MDDQLFGWVFPCQVGARLPASSWWGTRDSNCSKIQERALLETFFLG